jgi:predicted NAD/FAD-dependent oxidoreductase
MKNIAIIGAGLSGLVVANMLKTHAHITIFEKSRGVGGRMATRRAKPYFFDHGTQFFKARSTEFKQFLAPLIIDGIIKPWHANFVEIEDRTITQTRCWHDDYPHYVGTPHMNAIGKYLAQGLNIQLNTKISKVEKQHHNWCLYDSDAQPIADFDWVIITIPPIQATEILPLNYQSITSQSKMQGCFSLMLGFTTPLNLGFDAALIRGEDISWVSVNSSKPDRSDHFSLLVHSTNKWADQHIDDDSEQVINYLSQQTSNIIDHDVSRAEHQVVHGWRYANIAKQQREPYYLDMAQNLGICGDWFVQGRVEAAFTSAYNLTNEIMVKL